MLLLMLIIMLSDKLNIREPTPYIQADEMMRCAGILGFWDSSSFSQASQFLGTEPEAEAGHYSSGVH